MDFLHEGLVYLLYTIYLLVVISGFLTKVDMPQIGNITLATSIDASPTSVVVQPMGAIPGVSAKWSNVTYPELGRTRLEYTSRKADPGTGLVRHSFKVTLPTLESVVTDPGGPFQPPPKLAYVTVAEVHLFVHPRSTEAERKAAISTVTRSILVGSGALENVMADVVSGQSVF